MPRALLGAVAALLSLMRLHTNGDFHSRRCFAACWALRVNTVPSELRLPTAAVVVLLAAVSACMAALPVSSLRTAVSTRRCDARSWVNIQTVDAVSFLPVLDGHDEVPLLVQRDRVGEQRVEDFDELESGEEERLERDEHIGGALADAVERGPGRGGEQLGQLGARVGEVERQPNVDREWVVVELREQLSVNDDSNGDSSRKSQSSPANDPRRAAATRAGCCRAVRCVSCAKQSAASTHIKLSERRQLPKLGRNRNQRVVVQLR